MSSTYQECRPVYTPREVRDETSDKLVIDFDADACVNKASHDHCSAYQTVGEQRCPCSSGCQVVLNGSPPIRYESADKSHHAVAISAQISNGTASKCSSFGRAGLKRNFHEETGSPAFCQSSNTNANNLRSPSNEKVDGNRYHCPTSPSSRPGVPQQFHDLTSRCDILTVTEDRYSPSSAGNDYPCLGKIQADFDRMLESEPSSVRREIIINKFIIFLMTKRNICLEQLARPEMTSREDTSKRMEQYQPSGVNEASTDEFQLLVMPTSTSSVVTSAAAALNLTVPKKQTAMLSSPPFRGETHLGGTRCPEQSQQHYECIELSSAAGAAQCTNTNDFTTVDLSTSSNRSTAASNVSERAYAPSWSSVEASPRRNIVSVKDEPVVADTVEDERERWPPGYDNDDMVQTNIINVFPDAGDFEMADNSSMFKPQGQLHLKLQRHQTSLAQSRRLLPKLVQEASLSLVPAPPLMVVDEAQYQMSQSSLDSGSNEAQHSPLQQSFGAAQNSQILENSSTQPSSALKRFKPQRKTLVVQSEHIKRPMNSFMCWSHSERPKLSKMFPDKNNADISRMLGEKWRRMTSEEKRPFEEQSVKHSAQLLEKHPDYRYRPRRKEKAVVVFPQQKHQPRQRLEIDEHQTECCYSAIAGLMSLNQGWVSSTNHGLRGYDAASTTRKDISANGDGLSPVLVNTALIS